MVIELPVIRNTQHYYCKGWKIVKNLDAGRWTFRVFDEAERQGTTKFHSIDRKQIEEFVYRHSLEDMVPWSHQQNYRR